MSWSSLVIQMLIYQCITNMWNLMTWEKSQVPSDLELCYYLLKNAMENIENTAAFFSASQRFTAAVLL